MEVTDKLRSAYCRVIANDAHLLTSDANERSITHRFAIYMEQEFPEFNVDCEFNRKGLNVKRLPSFGIDPRSAKNEGINLYPDIIVHHRGTENNFIAVEAKPSSKDVICRNPQKCKCDRCKLRAYKADLKYRYAFYVIFPVDDMLRKYSDSK